MPRLQWLAEYTLAHPWRFIYLENVDLSWNYSENRDRWVCQDTYPSQFYKHPQRPVWITRSGS